MVKNRKQLEYMRPAEAAERLGVTRNTVMNRIAKGLYRAVTIGGVTFVRREDIETAVLEKAA
jgi:excisionase family DNA binding protein